MRLLLSIAFVLLVPGSSYAVPGKHSVADLASAITLFDKALVAKDTASLNQLLNTKLTYGHSNGWLESREELKANLYNGKLTYSSIVPGAPPQIVVEGSTGLVRTTATIKVVMEGKPLEFHLFVLQVWVYGAERQWTLIARQSTRVDKH